MSNTGNETYPEDGGWIVDARTTTSTSYGELIATWTVPPQPTSNDGQTIYMFPGMDNPSVGTIIQPVLAWYEGQWTFTSWSCCNSSGNWYGPSINVNPGDTIVGTLQSTCAPGVQNCSAWNITSYDETSGQSTTFPGGADPAETVDRAFAGALEVYDLVQCSDYPPNGSVSFSESPLLGTNTALFDNNFDLISNPGWLETNDSEDDTPQCNFNSQVAPTQTVLYSGSNPGLEVSVAGGGTVTSSPSGISCPGTCSAEFSSGTNVTLSASAGSGYEFGGWSVACSGTGSCTVPLIGASTVGASFTLPLGDINTLAGDGAYGYSGDGGAATSAELYYPYGVAVDSSGNIYIADANNYRIRKVTASTGYISTIAGDGTQGYSGDGGSALSAELGYPQGIAVDSAGNIYIADYVDNCIRKVTASTGDISTMAGNGTAGYSGDGGQAKSAQLNEPNGVAVDSSGNVYIADFGNFVVREIIVSTGIINTIAGDGTEGYSGVPGPALSAELLPSGVAVDSSGNVYIANFQAASSYADTCAVLKLTAGTISTIAGDGTCESTGDGGQATSAEISPISVAVDSAGDVYIAAFRTTYERVGPRSHSLSSIREVTASTGIINTIAGDDTDGYAGDGGPATGAKLNVPTGVAVDQAGNLYIADCFNNRIRAVGP